MRKLIPTHVVFNGKVGALTGKNALTAKVGETVLIVHSQANRDTPPASDRRPWRLCLGDRQVRQPAGDRSRDLVHPRRLGGGGALHVPAARHLRLRQPQPDRGRRARRHRALQGRRRVERRPDDAGQGAGADPGPSCRAHCRRPSARRTEACGVPARQPARLLSTRSETAMLIAFKLKLALVCAAGFAGPLAVAPLLDETGRSSQRCAIRPAWSSCSPARVAIAWPAISPAPASRSRRRWRRSRFAQPLAIMKHQVSAADYQRCVDDGACRALTAGRRCRAPTGRPCRSAGAMPTPTRPGCRARPASATGCRPTRNGPMRPAAAIKDDGLPVDDSDPSKRWLARYEREVEPRIRPPTASRGRSAHFGANEHGLLDLAGNVWEWTSTCFVRTSARRRRRRRLGATPNCGVRVVEGQHRAYVTDFIRDARAGGCAAGVPPSNLGFRLVRERKSWISSFHPASARRCRSRGRSLAAGRGHACYSGTLLNQAWNRSKSPFATSRR